MKRYSISIAIFLSSLFVIVMASLGPWERICGCSPHAWR